MSKPYPAELRPDVLRVARKREPGVMIEQIAKDFSAHPMTLQTWEGQSQKEQGTTL